MRNEEGGSKEVEEVGQVQEEGGSEEVEEVGQVQEEGGSQGHKQEIKKLVIRGRGKYWSLSKLLCLALTDKDFYRA